MPTEKQIQANRNNAKNSTGPRTEEGKARVSRNALKHGLLARDAVLPTEDPAEFEAQLAALEDDFRPDGALEHELVRQIADAQWRMRRLTRLETGYLAASLDNTRRLSIGRRCEDLQPGYETDTLLLGYSLMQSTRVLAHFARYDAHLGRRFERAIQQITHLREAREKHRPSESKQLNDPLHRPSGPETSGSLHTSNGAHLPPPVELNPHLIASTELCETNPISSNPNQIRILRPIGSPPSALTPLQTPPHVRHTAPNNTPCESPLLPIRPESPPR